jgi:hypothetical protein
MKGPIPLQRMSKARSHSHVPRKASARGHTTASSATSKQTTPTSSAKNTAYGVVMKNTLAISAKNPTSNAPVMIA